MLICKNPSVDSVHCYDTDTLLLFPTTLYELAYHCELHHFIDVVLHPSKFLLVTQEQTLLVSQVANMCIRSQEEGRMVKLEPAPPPA